MSNITKIILAVVVTAGLLIGGIFTGEKLNQPVASTQSFGSFSPVQGSTYSLQGAGVTATQNTIPLSSFTTPDGRAITMSMFGGTIGYGTLEPNTNSKIEDITFSGITQNANGSAVLTGVTRGNDFVTPYNASTTLAKAHAGGSYFILSNTAGFYGQQFLFANNVASSTATITFSNTAPPFYYPGPGVQSTGSAISTTSEFASVAYVNAVTTSGAPNASNAAKGIVQLATAAQAALSTILGSTGAALVLPSAISTSTPGNSTVTGDIITTTGSKIAQSFIDLTQAFSWSGLHTFTAGLLATASSTFTATTSIQASNVLSNALKLNGIPLQFPSTQCSSGQTWVNNGSGVLTCGYAAPHYNTISSTAVTASGSGSVFVYATSSAMVIPAGTLSASSTITVQGNITTCNDNNSDQNTCTFGLFDSVTSKQLATCSILSTAAGANTFGSLTFTIGNQSSLSAQSGISTCSAATSAGSPYQNAGSVNTSTLNTANAISLVMVVQTGNNAGTNSAALGSFSIVVNP